MPFFTNINTGYFCVAGDYTQIPAFEGSKDMVLFKPWRAVTGTLENYSYIDIPMAAGNRPSEVHCSPIMYDNTLSITFNRSIYSKHNNSAWVVTKNNIWQGYASKDSLTYVTKYECYLNNTLLDLPFFDHFMRVCPYKTGHIVTGGVLSGKFFTKRSILVDENLNKFEITIDGEPVYKCSITDENVLFYSKNRSNDIETYNIQQTSNFSLDKNSSLFS